MTHSAHSIEASDHAGEALVAPDAIVTGHKVGTAGSERAMRKAERLWHGRSSGSTLAEERLARVLFDRAVAALLIAVLSPLLLCRALYARLRHGVVFDRRHQYGKDDLPFDMLAFHGLAPGRDLAILFNIAAGKLAWVGPEARKTPRATALTLRPGLVGRQRLEALTGTHYSQTEEVDARENPTLLESLAMLARYQFARLMLPSSTARRLPHYHILGVRVDNHSIQSALNSFSFAVRGKLRARFAFVNPDCLNKAIDDEEYLRILDGMDEVFADGSGLQLAARLLGFQLDANVNGTDLFPLLCRQCVQYDHSIYLLGGRPDVAASVAEKAGSLFPGLRIVGHHHGYFDESETADVIDDINRAGADIVLVAFGAPTQEKWITQHFRSIDTHVLVGVGGLFDFYAERVSRAPRWLQDLGLEWIWRFIQEPSRMWRRYFVGNPLFVHRVMKQRRGTLDMFPHRYVRPPRLGSVRSRLTCWLQSRSIQFHRLAMRAVRRALDITISGGALLTLSPLLLSVMLMIRLESPGPVIFRQQRIGKWGRRFDMYKFRSMYIDAEERKRELMAQNEMQGGVIFKMKNDPRITTIGRFIRKYSVDELPQLWNVLKGDMALVGPRPPVQSEVDLYTLDDRRRLEVKPGITCLWQVSGRSDIPFNEQVELDVNYIDNEHILEDLKILLRTVPAVLFSKGSY